MGHKWESVAGRGKKWEDMALFCKSQHRSLDAKGRLVLPAEYREAIFASSATGATGTTGITGTFVLTGFYGRLVGYLVEDWEKNREQLSRIKNPSLKLSRFMSKVLGLAEELTLDAHGRVRIPQPLMREAGLSRDVVLVGMGSKFEVWDQERFEHLELEDVSDDLAAGNIDISL